MGIGMELNPNNQAVDPEIARKFRRRRLIGMILILACLPCGFLFEENQTLGIIILIALLVSMFIVWRCPSCGKTMGASLNPEHCASCGTRLRDRAGRSINEQVQNNLALNTQTLDPNIAQEFRRSQKMIIIACVLAIPCAYFLTTQFMFGLVLLIGVYIWAIYHWRCPSCRGNLGRGFNPKFCNRCGVRLRE